MKRDEMLGVAAAAAEIGVNRQTIHAWIRNGELEAMTLPAHGQKLYVRRSQLLRVAEGHKRVAGRLHQVDLDNQ
jgi:predicted site-specific integrase-resolvase